MLNCRQATQLLSERQDRPLSLNEKLSLNLHVGLCTPCRRFGKQIEQLSDLAKQYRAYHSPESMQASADPSSSVDAEKPDQIDK